MVPKQRFIRYLPSPQRIIGVSLLLAFVVSILFGSGTLLFLHHKRTYAWDLLVHDINSYLSELFQDLHITSDKLQPLTFGECGHVSRTLTTNAAFNVNVRALLLVRNNMAFCSSATGPMAYPMSALVPEIDTSRLLDVALMAETPMMPGRPTLALWYRNDTDSKRGIFATLNVNLNPYLMYSARQHNIVGIALINKQLALSSFSQKLLSVSQLPLHPLRTFTLKQYPLTIYLYGNEWPLEDIQLSILAGILAGVFGGLLYGFLAGLYMRPGKEILSGIRHGQFFMEYQPVVASDSLALGGIEALIRWHRPGAGLIPPDAFINFAEAQQLIVPLTRHLFTLIARDAHEMQSFIPQGAKLGVNLSPNHLHSPGFKEDVLSFVNSLPKGHFQVVFEITERDMLQEQAAHEIFDWMHEQGFHIAVDDFGTGHSALIYLERFTLDYLKIDRGFIHSIGMETVTTPVLDTVLTLARRLNMTTVAEGVETREQASWLIDQGVNYLQGYYFSRPLPLEKLRAWVQNPPAVL